MPRSERGIFKAGSGNMAKTTRRRVKERPRIRVAR